MDEGQEDAAFGLKILGAGGGQRQVAQAVFDVAIQAQQAQKPVIAVGQRAYAELLTRYRPAVQAQMLKMVPSRAEADDLTMEAFGKAFRNLHNYAPKLRVTRK